MGIIKSIDNWRDGVGGDVGDFVQNTLTEAGKMLCNARAKYPNSFFDRGYGKGLANTICGILDYPPPSPPPPPFIGGQCVNSRYTVIVRAQLIGEAGNVIQEGDYTRNNVLGAISGAIPGRGAFPATAGIRIISSSYPPNHPDLFIPTGGLTDDTKILGVRVYVENNMPDNCGNPSPEITPDPPRNPDDFKKTENICAYDENGDPIFCEDVEITLIEQDIFVFPVCFEIDGKKICLDADGWDTGEEKEEEEKEEEEEEEKEILTWVLVTIKEIKPKAKRILREKAEDSEIFAGYIAFAYVKSGVKYWQPALPIRKEKNAFRVEEDSQIYSVYTNYDFEVNIQEVKKTIKVPKETP